MQYRLFAQRAFFIEVAAMIRVNMLRGYLFLGTFLVSSMVIGGVPSVHAEGVHVAQMDSGGKQPAPAPNGDEGHRRSGQDLPKGQDGGATLPETYKDAPPEGFGCPYRNQELELIV